ncbi:MAG: 3-deoxy-manno-octulosonate cytidylyltransferase [Lachnospiraceae bacterium]|nr:3-deoxy-manno-octulosonate cytidylyltransferase [Lachnospiraceae bacterium]
MHVIGVIPARYSSTRLPGKPLLDICGYPMVWWVYKRVVSARIFDDVIVATDDTRIMEKCNDLGINVVMTKATHRTAAERLQEVSCIIQSDYYIQINGDEPLIDIEALKTISLYNIPQDIPYGTNIITKIHDSAQLMDSSNIKVVFDEEYNAKYMSRTPIPYPGGSIEFDYYKHVGIIGYNRKMLDFYSTSTPGRLEVIEGIDTLRFIDYNKQLKFIPVSNCNMLSVDTPKDVEIIKKKIERYE